MTRLYRFVQDPGRYVFPPDVRISRPSSFLSVILIDRHIKFGRTGRIVLGKSDAKMNGEWGLNVFLCGSDEYVFVRNLDTETTDDEFESLFKPFGDIISAAVGRDEAGVNKGFGFVNFVTPEDANLVKVQYL